MVFFRDPDNVPVEQFQFIQKTRQLIEIRLAVQRKVTPGEEYKLKERILADLGASFELQFVYFNGRLPQHKNGKQEEFISEIMTL